MDDTQKSEIKQLFGRNCILDNFILRENLNYRGLFMDKESGSGSAKTLNCVHKK